MTPEGWREKLLGDLCSLEYGKSLPSSARRIGTISVYGANGVVGTHDEFAVRGPGIIVGRKGSVGEVAWSDADFWPIDTTFWVKPSADYDLRWLYWTALGLNLRELNSATGVPGLNRDDAYRLRVRVPPRKEQRKIASILSSVDEAIEATQAVIDQLGVVRKAMMAEFLTRGLPGRHTKFKPLGEWRLGRVEQGLSEAPCSWELVTLTSVARLESGHTPSRRHPEYWDGSIPWVSLHDSKGLDSPEITETAQTVAALGIENSSARLLPKGTVVFSRTATVGKATIMGREMCTSQDFANYVCGERIHSRYLMQLLRYMQPEWERLMAGSTHQTIYMPVFRDLQVLLPPLAEQIEIADAIALLDERIVAERDRLPALTSLKSALMSVLLTGELRVKPDEDAP